MASTPRQLIEQATRHASHIERLKSHEVRQLRDVLRAVEERLLGRLARNNISEWSRTRAEQQLAAFQAMLRESYGQDIIPALYRSMSDFGAYEAGFEARSLGNVAPTYNFTVPSDTQVMAAVMVKPLTMTGQNNGALLESFVEDWTERQIAATVGAVRSGFVQGQTTSQVISGLRNDVFPVVDRGLSVVVRTALQHVATQAREVTWRRNSDIIKRVRIVATLDDRTSIQCQSLDGQVFPIDSGPRPPFHPNCRTTVVAVLDDRFAILEEGGTRSARDPETGKVESAPARQTYYGWLKNQPADIQNSIIGPTRGKLLRDGGLSAQRFAELQLGKDFMPLTLEEMKQLDPVAFTRAGISL